MIQKSRFFVDFLAGSDWFRPKNDLSKKSKIFVGLTTKIGPTKQKNLFSVQKSPFFDLGTPCYGVKLRGAEGVPMPPESNATTTSAASPSTLHALRSSRTRPLSRTTSTTSSVRSVAITHS